MAIKAILHRIIVKQDSIDDVDPFFAAAKRAGLQIIQDERNREQAAVDKGRVVQVGPTAFRDFGVDESPIKVGDYVCYAKYGGKAIVDPATKEEFVALNDEDVIAVLSE